MNYKNYIVVAVGLSMLLNPSKNSCNSTAVQLYDGTSSLANSGTYFLSQNIASTVSITGNNITLNLNGHQIGALTIGSGLSNIFVSNGVVNGTAQIGTAPPAANTSNVQLNDLVIQNGTSSGINIIQASEVFISRALIQNATGTGLNVSSNSKRIFISDSEVCNSSGQGIFVSSNASEVIIRDTQSYGNGSSGAFIDNIAAQIYFIRFTAAENKDGIDANNSTGVFTGLACIDCIFENNTRYGINPSKTTYILKGCLAENNASDGFHEFGPQAGIVTQSVSTNNKDAGFDSTDGSPVRYTSNYAYNNTTNYSAGPFSAVKYRSSSAQFWRNIDGTDNT